MTRRILVLLVSLLSLALVHGAPAADLRVVGDTLVVEGELVRGDASTFAGLLAAHPELRRVSIASPGGDLATGLEMGKAIRARRLETYVEAGVAEAASAAAYLFMGGVERVVKGNRGVGVHAFYTPQPELRRLLKQQHGDDLLRTLNEFERRTQEATVAVVAYVTEMIGDTRIVSDAVRTGSDAMLWPPTKTLLEWKVATKEIPLSPEEIADPDWAYEATLEALAGWLDPSRSDALDARGLAILERFLIDDERNARLRLDLGTAFERVAPANRDQARQRIVDPFVRSIVDGIRAASAE